MTIGHGIHQFNVILPDDFSVGSLGLFEVRLYSVEFLYFTLKHILNNLRRVSQNLVMDLPWNAMIMLLTILFLKGNMKKHFRVSS
jgi:hypothetical protein